MESGESLDSQHMIQIREWVHDLLFRVPLHVRRNPDPCPPEPTYKIAAHSFFAVVQYLLKDLEAPRQFVLDYGGSLMPGVYGAET